MRSVARPLKVLPLVTLLACASTSESLGTGSGSEREAWRTGTYSFEGEITYGADSESETATATLRILGILVVSQDGSLRLSSSTGRCERNLRDDEADQGSLEVRFNCGKADFVLRPGRNVVLGTVTTSVAESIRRQKTCRQFMAVRDGRRTCIVWNWEVTRTRSEKTAGIRAIRSG